MVVEANHYLGCFTGIGVFTGGNIRNIYFCYALNGNPLNYYNVDLLLYLLGSYLSSLFTCL